LLTAYITGMIRQVTPLTLETIMVMVKGTMQIPQPFKLPAATQLTLQPTCHK